ncbi:ABC-three component system middle component 6 [Lactiplantibacillus plantarum]|uniref:ABC-three component system middle component 6 n=1 Tax=Lactiplantibacillus plantarum TaxID=1590 RepID=UPI003F53C3C3
MLLLDQNKQPQNTVLYLAATVSGLLLEQDGLDFAALLKQVEKVVSHKINPTFLSLALNFLFLIDKLQLDERGGLHVSKSA